jgi:putative phosphoribosyl transferase
MTFQDRSHAGRILAERLARYAGVPGVIVCALPRGGVLVGAPVAEALRAPLDVVVVRKLGVPMQPELAMGAIGSGGVRVLAHDLIRQLGISSAEVEAVIAREQRELERREAIFRGNAPPPHLVGRTVILVDDGIATGATMAAAAEWVRAQHPSRLVIGVPVAPPRISMELNEKADEVVCVSRPEPFYATGQFYEDFHEVSDQEVRDLMQQAAQRFARQIAERAKPA